MKNRVIPARWGFALNIATAVPLPRADQAAAALRDVGFDAVSLERRGLVIRVTALKRTRTGWGARQWWSRFVEHGQLHEALESLGADGSDFRYYSFGPGRPLAPSLAPLPS